MDTTNSIKALAEALLIGMIIGANREKSLHGSHPGLRDMLAISLIAGVCGLLNLPWLTGVALASVAVLLAIFHYECRQDRKGITTELAGLSTFCLAYLTATPAALPFGPPIAIGAAIVVVLFLEARDWLHQMARETISETEFNNTLLFIAVVLVVYPLLPEGRYGLHQFFSPQQVWLFVILVSAISYIGYFLQKFLGTEKGLEYTSVIGGLASTTAATLNFARISKEHPEQINTLWRAAVIANTVQFPRTAFILYTVSVPIANACIPALAAMFVASAALAWLLGRRNGGSSQPANSAPPSGNPFRLVPGLKFGAMFAAILFLSKAGEARFGTYAVHATSVLGGLVDVATVILSASELFSAQKLGLDAAAGNVMIALTANIILKIILAAGAGTRAFALRLAASSALSLAAAAVVWWLVPR